MSERFVCTLGAKRRYINTLPFLSFPFLYNETYVGVSAKSPALTSFVVLRYSHNAAVSIRLCVAQPH